MITSLILSGLNRLIRQESWAQELLLNHAGKTVCLDVAGVRLNFGIDEQAVLTPADVQTPDVCIQLPVVALPHLLDQQGLTDLTAHARISGDASLAEAMARLLAHLRPDVGASLSPFVGDILANRIERGVQTLVRGTGNLGRNLGANLFEYVSDEQAWVVKQSELATLQQETMQTETDLQALEKRVERVLCLTERKI